MAIKEGTAEIAENAERSGGRYRHAYKDKEVGIRDWGLEGLGTKGLGGSAESNAHLLLLARTGANDARLDVEPIEQPIGKPPPVRLRQSTIQSAIRNPQSAFQSEPRRAARHRLTSHQDACRLTALHHSLQPQPGREGQSAHRVGRRLGHVEDDETEVARLKD